MLGTIIQQKEREGDRDKYIEYRKKKGVIREIKIFAFMEFTY